jgi:hypothetical protein
MFLRTWGELQLTSRRDIPGLLLLTDIPMQRRAESVVTCQFSGGVWM